MSGALQAKSIRAYGHGSSTRPVVHFVQRAALYIAENVLWLPNGHAYQVESIWTTPKQAEQLQLLYRRHTLFSEPTHVAARTCRVDLFPEPRPTLNKRVNGRPLNGQMNLTDGATVRTGDSGAFMDNPEARRKSWWNSLR